MTLLWRILRMSLNPKNNEDKDKDKEKGKDDKPKKKRSPRKKKDKPIEPIPPPNEVWSGNVKPLDTEEFKKHKFKTPPKSLKDLKNLKDLEEVKVESFFSPDNLLGKILDTDDIEITYVCSDCSKHGKTFCRMPENKENLMNRVMSAIYMHHAMSDLFCPTSTIDLRISNDKGELI